STYKRRMCSTKTKVVIGMEITPAVARINGRPVLQPTCNHVPTPDKRSSFKKMSLNCPPPPPPPSSPPSSTFDDKTTTPVSPKSKSPRPPAIKRGSDPNGLNASSEKVVIPSNNSRTPRLERKKSKSFKETSAGTGLFSSSASSAEASLHYSSSLIVESPGSIAAVRREQMAFQHAQRKMRIAHYGRSKSAKFEANNVFPIDSLTNISTKSDEEEKRCNFITPNSDPIYVAYHDEEWGVPVRDDKLLFELLVLSGAQVGSDWTSILKKRQDFRDAFSGFDAEIVADFTEKHMISISTEYGIDINRVRGVVDNSNRVLEIKKEFGSFSKYIWAFVNNKPISTQYKFGHKIPVKTSKSESISKDMVRRGFRFVGPTMVHSFMQAAGLTNDHLITCHRHLPCTLLTAR
ncbi:DNA-3-methyladenine glycosylase, putative, partial [Ricinus communis]